ncbi:hypothetical protein L3X38_025306 [Prunus dulcis]|uniref:Uncharacterized protein n=1 Tax=Prunus dulcis TaxID=3755 RepID=A0AAD4W2L3_PRUDU|nr:hypothetical protein L3X38_025306 [Prunus dulcis]
MQSKIRRTKNSFNQPTRRKEGNTPLVFSVGLFVLSPCNITLPAAVFFTSIILFTTVSSGNHVLYVCIILIATQKPFVIHDVVKAFTNSENCILNFYGGDQDSVIPLTGTRTGVDGLAEVLELNTTVPYRVWFEEKQVAGWTQVYGDVLSFATIRGAGHTAPYTHSQRDHCFYLVHLWEESHRQKH